jgi:hypothetical protein
MGDGGSDRPPVFALVVSLEVPRHRLGPVAVSDDRLPVVVLGTAAFVDPGHDAFRVIIIRRMTGWAP